MMLLDLSGDARRISEFTIADNAEWTFAADFTIELFRVVWVSSATQMRLISHYNTTGNQQSWLVVYGAAAGELWINCSTTGSSSVTTTYTWTPTNGVEYNLAFERSGTTVRIYVDGVKVANNTVSGALHNSTDVVAVGAGRAAGAFANVFTGTCKAIRVTKDVARYATDTSYTVPTLPLPTG